MNILLIDSNTIPGINPPLSEYGGFDITTINDASEMSLMVVKSFEKFDGVIIDPDIDYDKVKWDPYGVLDILCLITEDKPDIPIFIYTNNMNPRDMQKLINFGIDGWYKKGEILPQNLVRIITDYFAD